MKRFWNILIAAMVVGILIFAAGCSKDNNSNPASANETDHTALAAIMSEDSDLEAVNSWAGDSLGGGSPLDSAVTPIRWVREGSWQRVSVMVEIQGDTLATITRTASFNGTLHLLIDTTGGIRTVINKPMYNTLVRKAHARRIARTHRPRENWRLYEVTPEVMLSSSPDSNTVRPAHVQFYSVVELVPTLIADITDPLNTWFKRDSLPEIPQGGELEVHAIPNVTDTVAVFLHPHVWRDARMRRQPMVLGSDNTYFASFYVGQRIGIHLTAPDILSRAALYTSDGAYDAGSWAIPYRVVAAQ